MWQLAHCVLIWLTISLSTECQTVTLISTCQENWCPLNAALTLKSLAQHWARKAVRYLVRIRIITMPSAGAMLGQWRWLRPGTEPVLSQMYQMYSAVQSQNAVSAYFTSKQILPFIFAEQYWLWCQYWASIEPDVPDVLVVMMETRCVTMLLSRGRYLYMSSARVTPRTTPSPSVYPPHVLTITTGLIRHLASKHTTLNQ